VTKQSVSIEIAADFVLATFGIATPQNIHPHPNPLPSREREIMEGVCYRLGSQ